MRVKRAQTHPRAESFVVAAARIYTLLYIYNHIMCVKHVACEYAWCDDDDVDYMISFSRFICLFDVFLLLSFTWL